MSAEVIKVFDYIGEKLGIAIDWTQENVMPYLEDLVARFVKLNIIENTIGVVVCVLLLIAVIIGSIVVLKSYKKCKETKNDTYLCQYWKCACNDCDDCDGDVSLKTGTTAFVVCLGITFLVSIPGIICCTGDLIKWVVVPELKIIEEISYMMQTMGA